VGLLELASGVLEYSLGSLDFLDLLGSGETVVKHELVVLDESHLTFELIIVLILTLREQIVLLHKGGSVAVTSLSEPVISLIISSQVVVESAISVGWLILNSQSTREVRDVGVSSSSIVHIDNRF